MKPTRDQMARTELTFTYVACTWICIFVGVGLIRFGHAVGALFLLAAMGLMVKTIHLITSP